MSRTKKGYRARMIRLRSGQGRVTIKYRGEVYDPKLKMYVAIPDSLWWSYNYALAAAHAYYTKQVEKVSANDNTKAKS